MTPPARWLVLQHVDHEGPGLIATVARRRGLRLSIVRPDQGALPAGLDEGIAGVIAMGGPMSVNDADPWLRAERVLLRNAVAAGLPVLGVCLGAQQLAAAHGAPVRRGWSAEVGFGSVQRTPEGTADPVIGPGADPIACFHWHEETFELPPRASHLASSMVFTNQAFRLGERAYGLQFHVELDAALVAKWQRHLPQLRFDAETVAVVQRTGESLLGRFFDLAV